MIKSILIVLFFSGTFCLKGQFMLKEAITLSKNADTIGILTLKLDTIQQSTIAFEISIQNTSQHLITIENPLLSLWILLINENGNQVALRNLNNLVLIEGHGEKKKRYDLQNRLFEVTNIVSSLSKKTMETWYERKWTLLPKESVTYFLNVKYMSALPPDRYALGIRENEYKPIHKGKYEFSVFQPTQFYGENDKITGSFSFLTYPVIVILN